MPLYRTIHFMSFLRDRRSAVAWIVRYLGMNQDPSPPNEIETDPAPNGRLSLKEIRLVVGDKYPAIITVAEAAEIARLAVKTIHKKVSEGGFKQSVKRGKPLRFWRDRFVQEAMR